MVYSNSLYSNLMARGLVHKQAQTQRVLEHETDFDMILTYKVK